MDFITELKAKERIRDPLYGFIFLTEDELKIIDLPVFQRLRRIHQLALTKYTYPSAEHSRFVHSIGVMHAATLIFQELYKRNEENFKKININPLMQLKILRFAALLHDIGHVPFSHAVEKCLIKGSHEELSEKIIENTSGIQDVFKDNGIKSKDVTSLITGESKDPVLSRIISGEFDADRADYLLRDSYTCGVEYGMYDFIRYVGSFIIDFNKKNEIGISINEDNIPIIESFVTARYYYNQQVPFHRTRQAYDIALEQYIKEQDKRFSVFDPMDFKIDEFIMFDDYTIIEKAKEDFSSKKSEWASYVLRLEHLRCFEQIAYSTNKNLLNIDESLYTAEIIKFIKCFEQTILKTNTRENMSISMKKELDKSLGRSGLEEGNNYFVKYTQEKHHKLVNTTGEREDNRIQYYVKPRYDKQKKDLMDCSPVLKGLKENPNQIVRYFCKDNEYLKFRSIVEDMYKGV